MASGSKTKTKETFLVCECCGNHVQIRRKRNKMREYDHIKHMYCYKCKEVQAHVEKGEEIFYPQWVKELLAKQDEQDII